MLIKKKQAAFTLIEITIALLIVSILLGYTLSMLPKQQELKQYKQAKQEMQEINNALYSFAQVKGYLPCPAFDDGTNTSNGFECRLDSDCDGTSLNICHQFSGFVPGKALGINGRYSPAGAGIYAGGGLLLDPWGSPYRYHVADTSNGGAAGSDFVILGDMQAVGIADLNPNLDVCNDITTAGTACDNAAERIIETAPAVILSLGKSKQSTPLQDENDDDDTVYISTSFKDSYDDIVMWLSPNILYSKMIEAGQLP